MIVRSSTKCFLSLLLLASIGLHGCGKVSSGPISSFDTCIDATKQEVVRLKKSITRAERANSQELIKAEDYLSRLKGARKCTQSGFHDCWMEVGCRYPESRS